MDRYLKPGYRFSVRERSGVFEIREPIGRGASCVVYRAELVDEHGNRTEHLLKEYAPMRICLFRGEDGALFTDSEKDQEKFEAGLRRFQDGYEKQAHIRRLSELKNSTGNIQGIYHANGTRYIDMTCFHGQTYDTVQEKSLHDLLRRMRAVAQVIGNYHNAGFLHLDIKPENIYTIPETCEMVMLFDFDSVTAKADVIRSPALSRTRSWAAPEQISPGKREGICEATDLFAVGEMIFWQLFRDENGKNRHSEPEERRSFSRYDFDLRSVILENVDPRVLPMLEDLLHHTICGLAKQRYQSADELIAKLDEVIRLADPERPCLKKAIPTIEDCFVGRDAQMGEIHQRLMESGKLFLSGVGGIGKSELARQYAARYQAEYDAIVFMPYLTDLLSAVGDDSMVPICHFYPHPTETSKEYCTRKMRKLGELCDERTLIIIDNLDQDDILKNPSENGRLRTLLAWPCRILITTRCDFSGLHMPTMAVGKVSDEAIRKLFTRHYPQILSSSEAAAVDEIIRMVDGHTLAVELLAKQMEEGCVTPDEMLEKLRDRGLRDSGAEAVDVVKDGIFHQSTAYDFICQLFDLSRVSEGQQYILDNLTLVPYTGISRKLFKQWCELESLNELQRLIKNGWVHRDIERDYISLHPVIAEAVHDTGKSEAVFESFLCHFTSNLCGKSEETSLERLSAEESLALCFSAIKPIRAIRNASEDLAVVCYLIGNFLSKNHSFGMAEQYIRSGLRLLVNSRDDRGLYMRLRLINDLGLVYFQQGELFHKHRLLKDALTCFEQCIDISCTKNIGRAEDIAGLYNNIGNVYYSQHNYAAAQENYLKSISILESSGIEDIYQQYINLANMYRKAGAFKESLDFSQKAKEAAETGNNPPLAKARVWHHFALLYRDLANFQEALLYAKAAHEIYKYELHPKNLDLALSECLLGELYILNGENQEGQALLAEAEPIYIDVLGEDHEDTIRLRQLLSQRNE